MHSMADTLYHPLKRGGELGKMVEEFRHLEGRRARAGGGTGSLVDHCPTKTYEFTNTSVL